MAVYRFRVTFEDYDDVVREIEIKSNQTFEDLHKAIHQSTGYNPEYSSSFYVANDQWIKSDEITYLPNQKRIDRGIALMANVKLSKYIDDPHQKFYYTFNFDRPFDFHIELLKIILEETAGTVYPKIVKSSGDAPKQFGNVVAPVASTGEEELDFLNELAYSEEETEEFSEVEVADEDDVEGSGVSIKGGGDEEEEEEEDEFGSEFSDDENFEDDRRSGGGGDDY